jgi:hypothetical protein
MSASKRDISGKTLSTINVISSWVVNTFYNYLHQQAVQIHTSGRSSSVTDAYKFIVRQYLDSFNDGEGYRRNLTALHKYYMDNTRYSSIPFDEWMRDVLKQFVPIDYFSIMSNNQQDVTLRCIIVNSINQFSSDVVCTQILDTLITSHDNPNLIQIMKKNMSSALIFEREKLFQALFKSSIGVTDNKPMNNMKTEITKLIEENVILKNKNKKAIAALKSSLEKLKERDVVISNLLKKNSELVSNSDKYTYRPEIRKTEESFISTPKRQHEQYVQQPSKIQEQFPVKIEMKYPTDVYNVDNIDIKEDSEEDSEEENISENKYVKSDIQSNNDNNNNYNNINENYFIKNTSEAYTTSLNLDDFLNG